MVSLDILSKVRHLLVLSNRWVTGELEGRVGAAAAPSALVSIARLLLGRLKPRQW